ncbi:MAG TPA: hypothetical protein VFQ22_08210 [Longimicrobiales bacterium]|nr:hypothetical protein [Longimicrobiales bacterium]
MSVHIAERAAPVFDDVLANPRRSATLTAGAFLLDLNVSADYLIDMGDDDGDEDGGGLLVGVRAGYTFAPGDTSWRLDAINDVAGGPDLLMRGPYVRVAIGGWGGRDAN